MTVKTTAPSSPLSAIRTQDLTAQPKERIKPPADPANIDKTAREFEAMVLTQMLQPMFSGLKIGEGAFGGGHAEEMFHSLLVEEYGKVMAKAGGLGIADMVRREMLKAQEDTAIPSSIPDQSS